MTKHRIPRLETSVTIRFPAEEAAALRAAAKQLGLTYSEIVRRAVAAFISPPTITTGSSTTVTVDSDATWSHLA